MWAGGETLNRRGIIVNDSDYLARRAAQERKAAAQALSAAAREAHLKLAEEYEREMGSSDVSGEAQA
jgi:hypothetical protein